VADAGAEEGDDEEKGMASRGGESTQMGLCNDVPVETRVEGASVSFGSSGMGFEGLGTKTRLRGAGVSMSSFGDAFDLKKCCMEVVLNHEKKIAKDPRQAYGAMQEQMYDIIRAFRDIDGKHIYFTAKCEKTADESGRILYAPSMPGNKTGQALPYFFDEVLALRVEKDAEGVAQRALMCDSDGIWQAKDRSGKLDTWEAPDLSAIIAKIGG
jgi:hypothetical protein